VMLRASGETAIARSTRAMAVVLSSVGRGD